MFTDLTCEKRFLFGIAFSICKVTTWQQRGRLCKSAKNMLERLFIQNARSFYVNRTGKERKKTKKQNPRKKRLPKPTVPRNNMLTIKQAISEEIRQTMTLNLI